MRTQSTHQDPMLRWLKPLAIVVGSLALLGTALPAILFVLVFTAIFGPFTLPFLFYEGEQEWMEEHAHQPKKHLRWAGNGPHPEVH